MVLPQAFEIRAQLAQFLYQGCGFICGAGAYHIGPKSTDDETGDAFPIRLDIADPRVAEDQPQNVAFAGRQAGVVGQDGRRSAVPGNDVPSVN